MKLKQVTVKENIAVGNGGFYLTFPRDFIFKAGQSIGITTNLDLPPRLYSLASGEKDSLAGILYKVVNEGQLTPQLTQLKEGDSFYISEPTGSFFASNLPSVWLASGTGIAPFVAMLKSGYSAPLLLLQGSSITDGLWFSEFFASRLGNKYLPCITRQTNAVGFQGRVTQKLDELDIINEDTMFYLCGRAEMVVDSRDILINKGVAFNRIVSEIYF